MKKYLLSLSSLLLCLGAFAQQDIYLQFNHLLGDQPFALNIEATAPGDYPFQVERLEYYVSGISITHDGGQVSSMPDVHFLVRANEDPVFEIGNFNIDQIENIDFYIGVGPEYNHEDPASYPGSHPLAPKNPSMHWGWSSGYRFIAMEGTSGSGDFVYEIHALGDDHYVPSMAINR